MIFIKKSDIMHKISILFFQSVLPVTKNLLEKPDTVEGFLCSFAVSCITVSMCYIGTLTGENHLMDSTKKDGERNRRIIGKESDRATESVA